MRRAPLRLMGQPGLLPPLSASPRLFLKTLQLASGLAHPQAPRAHRSGIWSPKNILVSVSWTPLTRLQRQRAHPQAGPLFNTPPPGPVLVPLHWMATRHVLGVHSPGQSPQPRSPPKLQATRAQGEGSQAQDRRHTPPRELFSETKPNTRQTGASSPWGNSTIRR